MAAAKPGKPGRGAGGRDAAYEKVKLIVPDCTDEEVQQALQQSLGDADQAVIALTDSAPRNSGPCSPKRQTTSAHSLCIMQDENGRLWTRRRRRSQLHDRCVSSQSPLSCFRPSGFSAHLVPLCSQTSPSTAMTGQTDLLATRRTATTTARVFDPRSRAVAEAVLAAEEATVATWKGLPGEAEVDAEVRTHVVEPSSGLFVRALRGTMLTVGIAAGRGRGAGRGASVDREAPLARRDFSSPDPGLGYAGCDLMCACARVPVCVQR